jgi:hypothetical protein
LHLAYYAELRAAMSLLACEGIGIFKDWHYIVDAKNGARKLPTRVQTHKFAWDCLSFWAHQPASGVTFANVVEPHGRTLEDWFNPIGGAAPIAPQAQNWFRQWGMDLQRMALDQAARNDASYRPAGVPELDRIDPLTVVEFLDDTWRLIEPGAPASFDSLDRHILRLGLERWFVGTQGKKPTTIPKVFRDVVDRIVVAQNFSTPVADAWKQFLTRKTAATDPSLFTLSNNTTVSGASMYFALISRAVLLLRLATGTSKDVFHRAGISKQAIGFWRNDLGIARGFWSGGHEPIDLTDLWIDVESALTEVGKFRRTPAAARTYQTLTETYGHTFPSLGGCERVAVWNVAAA